MRVTVCVCVCVWTVCYRPGHCVGRLVAPLWRVDLNAGFRRPQWNSKKTQEWQLESFSLPLCQKEHLHPQHSPPPTRFMCLGRRKTPLSPSHLSTWRWRHEWRNEGKPCLRTDAGGTSSEGFCLRLKFTSTAQFSPVIPCNTSDLLHFTIVTPLPTFAVVFVASDQSH